MMEDCPMREDGLPHEFALILDHRNGEDVEILTCMWCGREEDPLDPGLTIW